MSVDPAPPTGGPDAGARPAPRWAGRGALKLGHALEHFTVDPRGWVCADFGCNVGGFTDCLLRAGAARVHAVDTGYGALDYRLRVDPRVVVMERTNALHAPAPEGGVDLVVVDLAWTTQRLAIPAARRWLRPTPPPRAPDTPESRGAAQISAPKPPLIISLVKPHYEAKDTGLGDRLSGGVLDPASAQLVLESVLAELPALGVAVLGAVPSPILGGAGKGNARGNAEFLALLAPI